MAKMLTAVKRWEVVWKSCDPVKGRMKNAMLR
jgi:hypothetical protein